MPNVRHVSKQSPCEPRQRQPFNLSDFDAKKGQGWAERGTHKLHERNTETCEDTRVTGARASPNGLRKYATLNVNHALQAMRTITRAGQHDAMRCASICCDRTASASQPNPSACASSAVVAVGGAWMRFWPEYVRTNGQPHDRARREQKPNPTQRSLKARPAPPRPRL
jgi:hypothetical protein